MACDLVDLGSGLAPRTASDVRQPPTSSTAGVDVSLMGSVGMAGSEQAVIGGRASPGTVRCSARDPNHSPGQEGLRTREHQAAGRRRPWRRTGPAHSDSINPLGMALLDLFDQDCRIVRLHDLS